jgi:hypothetical protein
MMVFGKGSCEPSRGLRDRVGRGDADGVEALRAGEFVDQCAQALRLQKSSFS